MIKQLYAPFQHWAMTGSVWMVSDTHFDDKDCKLMNPDWPEPEEYIKLINQRTYPTDTLIHLGDVGNPKWIEQLRPKYKVLILGNHDKGARIYKGYFDEIFTGPLFIAKNILISHEPINLPFCLNIHGHDHNKVEHYISSCKHLNIAANVVDYKPISLGKLIKDGILSDVKDIHRITINKAEEKK